MLDAKELKSPLWAPRDTGPDTRTYTYVGDLPSCGIKSISIKHTSTGVQLEITADSKDVADVLCNKLMRDTSIPIKISGQDKQWLLSIPPVKAENELIQLVKSLHEFAPFHVDSTLWKNLANAFRIKLPEYPGQLIPYKSNYSAPTVMRKIPELVEECKMTQWIDSVFEAKYFEDREKELKKPYDEIARYGTRIGINDMEKCGKGAYAEEDIPEGVFIAEYEGDRKDFTEELQKELRDYGYRVIENKSEAKKEICIDAIQKGGKGRFFQHLRQAGTLPKEYADANLEAISLQTKSGVRVFFRTKRAIKRGELLGFSYVPAFLELKYCKDRGFIPCAFTKVGWHPVPIPEIKVVKDESAKSTIARRKRSF